MADVDADFLDDAIPLFAGELDEADGRDDLGKEMGTLAAALLTLRSGSMRTSRIECLMLVL